MESRVLKNISYRIYLFLFALFIFGSSSTLFFNNNNTMYHAIGKEVPNIEIHNFTLYLINDHFVQAISEGREALRYENREEFYDVSIDQVNQSVGEYLTAPFAMSEYNRYIFPRGVDYVRSDGLSFWSESGSYEYKIRVFTGKGAFKMNNETTDAIGRNIYYDGLNGLIKADVMNAKIALGSK